MDPGNTYLVDSEDSSGDEGQTGSCAVTSGSQSYRSPARKRRRGVIEKRRRDRINHSLDELKRLVPQVRKEGLEEGVPLYLSIYMYQQPWTNTGNRHSSSILRSGVRKVGLGQIGKGRNSADDGGPLEAVAKRRRQRILKGLRVSRRPQDCARLPRLGWVLQWSMQIRNKTANLTLPCPFPSGFRECASEVARYLVSCEGMDDIRFRLMSHLQMFMAHKEFSTRPASGTQSMLTPPPPPHAPSQYQTQPTQHHAQHAYPSNASWTAYPGYYADAPFAKPVDPYGSVATESAHYFAPITQAATSSSSMTSVSTASTSSAPSTTTSVSSSSSSSTPASANHWNPTHGGFVSLPQGHGHHFSAFASAASLSGSHNGYGKPYRPWGGTEMTCWHAFPPPKWLTASIQGLVRQFCRDESNQIQVLVAHDRTSRHSMVQASSFHPLWYHKFIRAEVTLPNDQLTSRPSIIFTPSFLYKWTLTCEKIAQ